MAINKATPRTREQALEERRAELDVMQQMEAQRQTEQAEQQRDHNEFAARVQARRNAIDAHIRQRWLQMEDRPMTEAEMAAARREIEQEAYAQYQASSPPTLDAIYEAKRAEELAAREEAERQRLAAITPRQLWKSTLSYQDQVRVEKWEAINKLPWPGFSE